MVVVSTPVTHENVPAKITTALPSYWNYLDGYGAYSGCDEAGNVIETHEHTGELNKMVKPRLAFICQSRRERVATLERHFIGPSSQICRKSYQQTRLIAIEPPGNWRAALKLRTDFGSRPGAPNG
jgi:hypothetical protein